MIFPNTDTEGVGTWAPWNFMVGTKKDVLKFCTIKFVLGTLANCPGTQSCILGRPSRDLWMPTIESDTPFCSCELLNFSRPFCHFLPFPNQKHVPIHQFSFRLGCHFRLKMWWIQIKASKFHGPFLHSSASGPGELIQLTSADWGAHRWQAPCWVPAFPLVDSVCYFLLCSYPQRFIVQKEGSTPMIHWKCMEMSSASWL